MASSEFSIPPEAFSKKVFNYIIVGGGTAGLVLASRLTDNPDISVGVIEAGSSAAAEEPTVKIPGYEAQTVGTEYDWKFETIPQEGIGGKKLPWPRGKMLGGTSGMNLLVWNRAAREDYDAWEELGSEGWNWQSLLPYFERSEFLASTDKGSPSSGQRHVTVTYPREYAATHQFWHETLNNLGIQTNTSHMDGSNVGVWTSLATIDPQNQERSYSTTGYLDPIATRENLSIVTGAEVDEILFDLSFAPSSTEAQSQNPLVAKGVRYHVGKAVYQASASQEIILCAGSVGSPQILELSGIGNQQILEKAGIHVKVHNPNVGENLQEHIMTISVYELDDNTSAPEHDLDPTSFLLKAEKEYNETKTGFLTTTPSSMAYLPLKDFTSESQLASLAENAHIIAEEATAGKDPNEHSGHHPAAAHILQRQFAPTSRLGQIEYVLHHTNSSPFFKGQVGKKYASLHQILQFPYSVGSIHVSSAEHSTGNPIIDPKYYEGKGGEVDTEVMLHGQEFGDRVMRTEPLSSIITRRVWPPKEEPGHDHDWASWIRNNTVTDWHPVGTCSMLPLRAGGVVDHQLRVYGTKNVRVIDASVFPLHISAHIQATIYAVAERGADIIKSTWEPPRN